MVNRVLHFIAQIGVGGCETQLLQLCRHMERSRFEFGICYYSHQADSMTEEFAQAGAKLFFVDKFGGISKYRFLQELRGIVRAWQPDIIHTWMYSANFWGRVAGRLCGYRRFIASDRTLMNYGPMSRLLEKLVGAGTIRTANSSAVADYVVDQLGIPRSKFRVVHNAVQIPNRDRAADRREVRREFGIEQGQPIVLMVGRQTPAKNYPMLFRAAQRIVSRRPEVTFLCAGHGELEDELSLLREQLGLGAHLRMLGLRHDVPRLMSAADIFCLTSNWEGFPNAVLEAMASGLPVIVTRFDAADEIIREGQTGLKVDLDNDAQLAEAIDSLLEDPARRGELGSQARQCVQEKFSWEKLVSVMTDLYDEFLAGRPR